jgi:hypothetical protein
MFRYLLILSLLLPIAAEASDHYTNGEKELSAGNYNQAKQHFYRCAKERDLRCFNKMGITNFQQGDEKEAIAWFNLGARVGDANSVENLKRLDQPVPMADLIQNQHPTQESTDNTGGDLMQILGGIGRGVSESTRRSRNCTSMVTGDIVETSCR